MVWCGAVGYLGGVMWFGGDDDNNDEGGDDEDEEEDEEENVGTNDADELEGDVVPGQNAVVPEVSVRLEKVKELLS